MDPILQKALDLIKIRPHSQGELTQKLTRNFPNKVGEIKNAITELKRVNLLSDKKVAELFVNHWSQKQVGRMRIKIEAQKKKLDPELVDQILAESGWDEGRQAKKATEVKLRTLNEKDKYKRKQKLMRFLQGRGFSNETIFDILQ